MWLTVDFITDFWINVNSTCIASTRVSYSLPPENDEGKWSQKMFKSAVFSVLHQTSHGRLRYKTKAAAHLELSTAYDSAQQRGLL